MNLLRILFLPFTILFYCLPLLAQEDLDLPCASDELHQFLMETNEDYRLSLVKNEKSLKHELLHGARAKSNETYVIPVVVHVLHLGEEEGTGTNISDSQILGAIQGLNNRFANNNGIGVDFNMEFCLAVRDPNDQPTDGINRVDASGITGYAGGGMNYGSNSCGAPEDELKALSRWPVDEYYNIWVVNKICGNYAGFAYYPWGGVNDGTVMRSNYMTNGSMILTHEIGHGFYIYHTFNGDGSNSNCPPNGSCLDQGDRVCDTPPHKQGDCGGTNPCGSEGEIWDDSRRNFMSYCGSRNRFTTGQMHRARAAAVVSPRAGLLTSMGCVPVSTIDAGVSDVIYPLSHSYQNACALESEFPVIKITNYGTQTLTQLNVYYQVNSLPEESLAWSGSLEYQQETIVELPGVAFETGENSITFRVGEPNGNADENAANDEIVKEFFYSEPTVSYIENPASTPVSCFGEQDGSAAFSFQTVFSVTEDFESEETTWTFANGAQPNGWVLGNATSSGGDQAVYISNDGATYGYDNTSTSRVHLYKDFYFPEWASNVQISFDWKCVGAQWADFLRVGLAPTSFIPGAGYNGYSDDVLGYTQYIGESAFVTQSFANLPNLAGQKWRLIFSWTNLINYGSINPAAIDNIVVSFQYDGSNSFVWNNGTTDGSIDGLAPGVYNVTAQNDLGCVRTHSFTIEEPQEVSVGIQALGPVAFCEGESVDLTTDADGEILWNNGAEVPQITVNESGEYFLTLQQNECEYHSDTIFVSVFPNPDVPGITSTENVLESTTAAAYQWYFESSVIDGATGQSHQATQNGEYQVLITDGNGCQQFSEPYYFTLVSADNIDGLEGFTIVPNPTVDHFKMMVPIGQQISSVRMYNAVGALVYQAPYKPIVDVSQLAGGIYIVEAWIGKIPVYQRVVLEK